MKRTPFLLVLLSALLSYSSELCGPGPIVSGFGSNGNNGVVVDTFQGKEWNEKVYLFRPAETKEKLPCVIFCHKYGASKPEEYETLLNHCASRGLVVFYIPARKLSFTRNAITKYDFGIKGIEEIVAKYSSIIDTARVGIIGHGFGGGAVPVLTKVLKSKGWGSHGTFMYILSPWYLYSIDERQMHAFPKDVKLVVQSYEDDNYNDPRIASDIYSIIGIPEVNKRYIMMYSDRHGNCDLVADYTTAQSDKAEFGETNGLDYYGTFRIIDALSAWAFDNDSIGMGVIYGNGPGHTIDMGAWQDSVPVRPMVSTVKPKSLIGKRKLFLNQWVSTRNPRIDVTRFRLARKLFFNYKKNMVKNLSSLAYKIVSRFIKEGDDISIIVNPLQKEYGADGAFDTTSIRFPNALDTTQEVSVFYPAGEKGPFPTVFFAHGYNGGKPEYYGELIKHIVSRGIAVVFSPYPTFPTIRDSENVTKKYAVLSKGFYDAVTLTKDIIDTSRLGFVGHSFGGGAILNIAWNCLNVKHWGIDGSFIFLSAPWYSYDISKEQMSSFPTTTKMLITIYDDDVINDHQMAVDIYNSINISPENKDFVTLYSDSLGELTMSANHFVPYGIANVNGVMDYLDYYGIFRHLDALVDLEFNKNKKANEIALGNGSKAQCYMGEWYRGRPLKPCTVTDNPVTVKKEFSYLFAWDNKLNPRKGNSY